MLSLLALPLALAQEGFGGMVLPNASPMDAGRGYAGAGGIAVLGPSMSTEGGVLVEAGVAPDEQFAFSLRLAGAPDTKGLVGVAGVRYLALEHRYLRLAPWVGVAGFVYDERGYGFRFGSVGWDGVVLTGLALEAGGERVHFDLSIPVVGVPIGGWTDLDEPEDFLVWMAGIELGVDFRLGDRHVVRIGQESFLPSFTWRWLGRRVYTELNVSTVVAVNVASFVVGGRF